MLVVLVFGGVVMSGILVYRQYQNGTTTSKTDATNTKQTTGQQGNTTTSPTDAYAGWQSYCDTVYHYCFKYPRGWTLTTTAAAKLGDTGGASLANPAKTLQVSYSNAYTQDSGVRDFMTVSLDKLPAAHQDLTIVGGYIPTSGDNGLVGNNVPGYRVVDSSLLATYPLAVGTVSQFPSNPSFTDQPTGTVSRAGAFVAKPAVTIHSLDETHAWFSSSDVKTSLLILKSFAYQPNA